MKNKLSVRSLALCLSLVLGIAGCASTDEVPPAPVVKQAPKPKAAPVLKPRATKPALSSDCRLILKRFVDAGVVRQNINVVIEKGLVETDFIGRTTNEAFQVLADARKLGCRYHPYYLN